MPTAAASSPAPSTATVLEFRCLFTHDLRRKQKRWQDGRIKYHTFNARVMVYDERGNSIGDMHWHGDYDFGEGEEVQPERGGVIVQVEELVERWETDLSELVDKRIQDKQQRQMKQLNRAPAPSAVLPPSLHRPGATTPAHVSHLRHRPLHNVIGTPTGHHGKASVPKESPFEQRQQAAQSPDDRAVKRRKYDDAPSKSGYAAALFGQSLALSATPTSSVSASRPRPRPGPSSDPPAEAEIRGVREDPKSARLSQPQPSRRLNQPGYAQALFGQSLTLSHTPVSSIPPRAQPRNELAPSPPIELNREDDQGMAQRSMQERPKIPRHLNQSISKPQPALPDNEANRSNELPAKGSSEVRMPQENRNATRRPQVRHAGQMSPAEVEIIELDDSEPGGSHPNRQQRPEKGTYGTIRHRNEGSDRSFMAEKKSLGHRDSVIKYTGKEKSLEDERLSKPGKTKGHDKNRKAETAVPDHNARDDSSERGASVTQRKAGGVSNVTKKAEDPVTELRIKSSKKRGLLMISEAPKGKKPRRQASADLDRLSEERERHLLRDDDENDPFKTPSPHLASKDDKPRRPGKSSKSLNTLSSHISNRGDHEDDGVHYPTLNRDGEWEDRLATIKVRKKPVQRTVSVELGGDDNPFQSPSPASPQRTHARSEPATRNDGLRSRRVEPGQVETTAQNVSCAAYLVERDARKAADASRTGLHPSTPPKVARDPYEIPSSPEKQGAPSLAAPIPCDSGSTPKSRHGIDADSDVLRPVDNNKKLSKSKQPRPSRRKVILEESDEQYGSEEDMPIFRRNTKVPKPSEDRPRLEKIKKNVKSRELIGFNLAALNAPLGIRGIGMPFSILSAAGDQSIQTRVSNHGAIDDSSGLVAKGNDDLQMLPPAPKPLTAHLEANVVPKKKSPFVLSSQEAALVSLATTESQSTETSAAGVSYETERDKVSWSYLTRDEPKNPSLRGDPASGQSDAAAGELRGSPRAMLELEIQKQRPAAPMPLDTAIGDGTEDALASLNQSVQGRPSCLQRSSTGQRHVVLETSTSGASTKTTTTIAPSSAASIKRAPRTRCAPHNPARLTHQQPSTTGQVSGHKTELPLLNPDTAEAIASVPAAVTTSASRVDASLQQPRPGFRRQPSAVEPSHAHGSSTKAVSNIAEGDQGVPTGAPVVPPPLDEPTSALARQSSTGGNQAGARSEARVDKPGSEPTPALPVQPSKPTSIIGLRRQVSAPRRIHNIAAKIALQAEAKEVSPLEANSKPASNARIANPASRGRKAALASHAAGQVPQRILPPTQPALVLPVSTADLAMTPTEQAPKEPERPKKKMTFPGFHSARSEGPWSREAFDLLESGRPS